MTHPFHSRSSMPRLALLLVATPALTSAAWAQPSGETKQVAAAVEKTLQRHAQDVHGCFAKALADRLDVSGKLELEVTAGSGGKVKDARVESRAPLVPEGLAACVVAAAKSWRLDDIEPGASVILPLTFTAQANQFVVKAEDAPLRGPQAKGKTVPPFAVKVLADGENVRARHVAVTHLVVSPANRVAMHRHPSSGKVLYVLKGAMRVLGPTGQEPIKLGEGDAVFIPPGYPHVIENMGRQIPVEMLQVFSPPGPEQVYRDPANASARAHFEVLRGPPPKAIAAVAPVVVRAEEGKASPVAGGKGQARLLLNAQASKDAVALSVVQLQPGAALAKQSHEKSEMFAWVMAGAGVLVVGSEEHPFASQQALFVPPGQPFAISSGRDEPLHMLVVHSPAGGERAFAGPAAAPARTAPSAQPPAAAPGAPTSNKTLPAPSKGETKR